MPYPNDNFASPYIASYGPRPWPEYRGFSGPRIESYSNNQPGNNQPAGTNQPRRVPFEGSSPWAIGGAGLAAGVGLLGKLFNSGSRLSENEGDYTFDPSHTAGVRFHELTNPNSDYNVRARSFYNRMAADTQPTINTLMGLSSSVGFDGRSSLAIASRQASANALRGQEAAGDQFTQFMLNNESNARGYLGLDYQERQYASQMAAQARASNAQHSNDFFDELGQIGGGLLGLLV